MQLHGYSISDSALLEADNIYRLRALIQHQLAMTPTTVTRAPLLERFNREVHSAGFRTLNVTLIDATDGQEATDYDDDLLLLVDTHVSHVVTKQ